MNIEIVKKEPDSKIPKPGQFWKHNGGTSVYQRIRTKTLTDVYSFKGAPNYFYSINIKTGDFEYTENVVPKSLEIIILEPIDNTIKFKEI